MKPRKSSARNGDARYRLDGQLHREDGPAIDNVNGYQEYWQHGQLHREDGPAIISPLGRKEWWAKGKCTKVKWPDGIDELLRDLVNAEMKVYQESQ
jgi:hypothetical protein